MSPSTDIYESRFSLGVAASDTGYHDFHDMELFEPTACLATTLTTPKTPPRTSARSSPRSSPRDEDHYETPKSITRHDSGYESSFSPSSYDRNSSKASHRHTSETRHQKRSDSQQHTAKPRSDSPPARNRAPPIHTPTAQDRQQQNSYFYFPTPEEMLRGYNAPEEEHTYRPPPQTIRYWMSNKTRRLEYAAIDAASRGLRGWMRRYVVPNRLVPRDSRWLTFDDDKGSVRRYRLELDDESGDDDEDDVGDVKKSKSDKGKKDKKDKKDKKEKADKKDKSDKKDKEKDKKIKWPFKR